MIVGVPNEIKTAERRVALTDTGVVALVDRGHEVLVQSGAGLGAGINDERFARRGAEIVVDAPELFERSQLIVKVKEPQQSEVARLHSDHILFAYLHLAATPGLALALRDSGATCVAYETLRDAAGRLPLLAPMSQIAGRLAVQAGAGSLESSAGGRGVLLGRVAGVPPATVLVIGAGVAGSNACAVAAGIGARVRVIDRDLDCLAAIEQKFAGADVETEYAGRVALESSLGIADLVIGTVHVAGARTPRLIDRGALRTMKSGSVIVDVSIDQGGCVETSRPTSHDAPTYVEEDVVHSCVANMPGAVPVTATAALTNATLPRVLRLADGGADAALSDAELRAGLNVHDRRITNEAVAAEVDSATDLAPRLLPANEA